jgi:hypothetical protein
MFVATDCGTKPPHRGTFKDAMSYRKLVGFLFVLALQAADALACSCLQVATADPVDAVSRTDAVFRARVISTGTVLTNDDGAILRRGERVMMAGFPQRLVALRVEELFKGEVAPLTVLVTGSGSGDCGYVFEDGKEYLVFATLSSEKRLARLTRSAPVLTTSTCSFTQPAGDAAELLVSIGAKFPPKHPAWISWAD